MDETASSRALEFIQEYEQRLPKGKRLYLRSDAAFYQAEVINHYSQPGRTFSLTAMQDSAVKAAIAGIKETEWQPFYTKDQSGH